MDSQVSTTIVVTHHVRLQGSDLQSGFLPKKPQISTEIICEEQDFTIFGSITID
jgi:hypothetical protein